jgi:hypothetical protein
LLGVVPGSEVEPDAAEPQGEHLAEVLAGDLVPPLASHGRHGDQPGVEQHAKVSGRGGPGVGEAGRELTGGEAAVAGVEHLQDVAASGVGQGAEHGVDVREVAKAFGRFG